MDCIEGTVRNKTITKVIITCFVEVEESSLFFITVIAGLLDVLLPSMYPWPTRHTVPLGTQCRGDARLVEVPLDVSTTGADAAASSCTAAQIALQTDIEYSSSRKRTPPSTLSFCQTVAVVKRHDWADRFVRILRLEAAIVTGRSCRRPIRYRLHRLKAILQLLPVVTVSCTNTCLYSHQHTWDPQSSCIFMLTYSCRSV